MLPTIPLGVEGWALRAWRAGDAPALAAHANNPKVWHNMSDSFPHPYTLEIAEHWVRQGHVEFVVHDDSVGKPYIVSANSSRPISMRRISLVPAPISYSLASRQSRPSG